jgi:hypothetical protein
MVQGVHHLPLDLEDLMVQDDLASLKNLQILVHLEFQEDLGSLSLHQDL